MRGTCASTRRGPVSALALWRAQSMLSSAPGLWRAQSMSSSVAARPISTCEEPVAGQATGASTGLFPLDGAWFKEAVGGNDNLNVA